MEMKSDVVDPPKPVVMGNEDSYLSAEEILGGGEDTDYLDVELPELGVGKKARVRSLNADEALKFRSEMRKLKDSDDREGILMCRIVALCTVDNRGERVFKTEEQAEALKRKKLRMIMRLRDAAFKHNGFVEGAADLAKNG